MSLADGVSLSGEIHSPSSLDPLAIPKQPVLSVDDERLYVFASTPDLFGLEASSGAQIWNKGTDALYTGTHNIQGKFTLPASSYSNV